MLAVNPNFPANSVPEFVAEARKRGDKLTFASSGVGGSPHIAMEMFRAQGKFDVLHVPFQGAAPAMAAVIGGQVDSLILPMSAIVGQANSGKLRMLGIASPARFSSEPNLKTFDEQGTTLNAGTWVGLMAPAKTPPAVVERLNRAMATALADPNFKAQLIKMNVEPGQPMNPKEVQTFMLSEYDRWGRTIRAANIKAE